MHLLSPFAQLISWLIVWYCYIELGFTWCGCQVVAKPVAAPPAVCHTPADWRPAPPAVCGTISDCFWTGKKRWPDQPISSKSTKKIHSEWDFSEKTWGFGPRTLGMCGPEVLGTNCFVWQPTLSVLLSAAWNQVYKGASGVQNPAATMTSNKLSLPPLWPCWALPLGWSDEYPAAGHGG